MDFNKNKDESLFLIHRFNNSVLSKTYFLKNTKLLSTDFKIALLIDGDNAKSDYISQVLAEAGKYGKVTIRRIYGNWTSNHLASWKAQVNDFSLKPVQKFDLAKGKNSVDTAMIIDAMDILHSHMVQGFCIASSDSDYTGLAQRLREAGLLVLGIGEANKTTKAFVNACDVFVFTENLNDDDMAQEEESPKVVKGGTSKKNEQKPNLKSAAKPDLPLNKITQKALDLKMIEKAFNMVVDDSGLAYMGEFGIAMRKLDPSFDSRTYGSATVSNLLKRIPDMFEQVYKDNGSALFIKLKN